MRKVTTANGENLVYFHFFVIRHTNWTSLAQGFFLGWVRAQGLTPDMPGGSENASEPYQYSPKKRCIRYQVITLPPFEEGENLWGDTSLRLEGLLHDVNAGLPWHIHWVASTEWNTTTTEGGWDIFTPLTVVANIFMRNGAYPSMFIGRDI